MTFTIKPVLVVIDETEYWDLERLVLGGCVDRIEAVYLYDESQYTYACETAPSYWLEPIRERVVLRGEREDYVDYEFALESVESDTIHSPHDFIGMYVHVRNAEGLKVHKQEPWKVDAESYEEAFREVVECYQCNLSV